uniref:Uncharacterized protein n=1 Tax=Romanomermis culicivorax TaxID=13658 RepID=A0A915J8M7_ROMCU
MASAALVVQMWTAIVTWTPMQPKKLMRTISCKVRVVSLGNYGANCKFVKAGGMALSTGGVVITNFGWEGAVAVVVDIGVLIACIGRTVVEETDVEAMVGNDVIVLVVVAVFRMVGLTSISGARGNGTLNSGCGGGFVNASRQCGLI